MPLSASESDRAGGFAALFLLFDPDQGIPAGRNWEREFYAQLRKTEAVIFLASAASVTSRWCFAEVSLARSLGKPVFPLRLNATTPGWSYPTTRSRQSSPSASGRTPGCGKDLGELGWIRLTLSPGTRRPYPDLEPFAPEDAGVLLGRDPKVGRPLDTLRNAHHEECWFAADSSP